MKILIKATIFLTLLFGAFVSCQDMEDIHADFIKDGEIVYAAVPDTVQTFSGYQRLQLKWLINNGANIRKSVVELTDSGQDFSKSVDVSLQSPLDSVLITLDHLEEKSYLFKTYNIDKDGNRSVKVQVTGQVFGEIYMSSLTNRIITSIVGGGTVDSLIINWRLPNDGNTGVEITYNSRTGEPIKKWVKPGENQTIIKNWESLGTMSYKSFYIPTPNAIDTFATQPDEVMLPRFIEFKGDKLSKEKWTIKDFSTEEPNEGAPNGLASAAIDNQLNTFWHTQWSGGSPGYPHHFTVDLANWRSSGALATAGGRPSSRSSPAWMAPTLSTRGPSNMIPMWPVSPTTLSTFPWPAMSAMWPPRDPTSLPSWQSWISTARSPPKSTALTGRWPIFPPKNPRKPHGDRLSRDW